ncbi:MAG: hypothetical protein R3B53_01240 [Candidatus Paceibacterota bacterium]
MEGETKNIAEVCTSASSWFMSTRSCSSQETVTGLKNSLVQVAPGQQGVVKDPELHLGRIMIAVGMVLAVVIMSGIYSNRGKYVKDVSGIFGALSVLLFFVNMGAVVLVLFSDDDFRFRVIPSVGFCAMVICTILIPVWLYNLQDTFPSPFIRIVPDWLKEFFVFGCIYSILAAVMFYFA